MSLANLDTKQGGHASNPDVQPKMAALHAQFVDRCNTDALVFAQHLIGETPGADEDANERIRVIAHRLAGAAAVFGHDDLCVAAAKVEDLARAKPYPRDAMCSAIRATAAAIQVLNSTQTKLGV